MLVSLNVLTVTIVLADVPALLTTDSIDRVDRGRAVGKVSQERLPGPAMLAPNDDVPCKGLAARHGHRESLSAVFGDCQGNEGPVLQLIDQLLRFCPIGSGAGTANVPGSKPFLLR